MPGALILLGFFIHLPFHCDIYTKEHREHGAEGMAQIA